MVIFGFKITNTLADEAEGFNLGDRYATSAFGLKLRLFIKRDRHTLRWQDFADCRHPLHLDYLL